VGGGCGHGGGGAMPAGKGEAVVAVAAEIEVGITPGVEFRRSAQGVAGPSGAGPLSGMVHHQIGSRVPSIPAAWAEQVRVELSLVTIYIKQMFVLAGSN